MCLNTQQSILGFVVSAATWLYNTPRPSTQQWYCISSWVRYHDTAGQSSTSVVCHQKHFIHLLLLLQSRSPSPVLNLSSSVSLSPSLAHSGAAGHRADHLSGQVQRADLRGPLLLHLGVRLRLGRHHPVHRLRYPLLLPAALRGRADWHGQDQVHLLLQLEATPSQPPHPLPPLRLFPRFLLFFSFFIRSSVPGPHLALTIERENAASARFKYGFGSVWIPAPSSNHGQGGSIFQEVDWFWIFNTRSFLTFDWSESCFNMVFLWDLVKNNNSLFFFLRRKT